MSFKLEGTGTQTVYTKKEEASFKYDKADDGDYVLIDGNYVEYNDNYAGLGYQRYNRTITSTSTNYFITTQSTDALSSGEVVGVTGTNGELTFTGLGAGTYTLTETDAPKGYNVLTTPIKVVITYEDPSLSTTEPTGGELATWKYSYTLDGVEQTGTVSAADGEFIINIANTSSALLPSTGGVGTVIFTAVGICVMAGAVVILYARRRREDEE
ncbi:MAG: LPXTG cell wall anchor domain-containing protein [Clostridiales bacterium]|nr:LPXTG cell wall anchor domain-containing protein [Clostridiales bacterium]